MGNSSGEHLFLMNGGYERPARSELRRLEAEDRLPHNVEFEDLLRAVAVDEEFFVASRDPAVRMMSVLPITPRVIAAGYLLGNRYRAIISWSERIALPLAGLLKASRRRIPLVALFSWISRPPKDRLLQHVHSHIDRLVLWNRFQRDFAVGRLGIPPSKVVLLKRSTDTQFFRPMDDESADMICSVGSEMRDFSTLVKALDGFAGRCHIAAGSKVPSTGNLALALPPNTTLGRKTYPELRELYARSRFVVVPVLPESDTDNGLTVTLEAFAMGRPVIISNTVAQETVRHGETGLLVPPGDPRALREAMDTLWNDPGRCRQMGLAAREYVTAHHRVEDFTSGVLGAVAEAAASHVG